MWCSVEVELLIIRARCFRVIFSNTSSDDRDFADGAAADSINRAADEKFFWRSFSFAETKNRRLWDALGKFESATA